ncbi:MAG: TetR/AcrR family transcriptional regulator C-terminal ligand-binding domain-containing protein [Candidatus Eiseniibacteriota bacterium]
MSRNPKPQGESVPRGRPRSQHVEQAVLNAARELIEKGGYAAATIEAIATRSGVAKTTIYRRWPNRATLVVDLLMRIASEAVPIPTGRDPMQALRTEMRGVARVAHELPGQLLVSLLGEAQDDPEVRAALHTGLFYPRTDASGRAIRRAQEAGKLREDIPQHIAVDLLFGPLFYRMFVRHEPLNDAFVQQVYKYVTEGLGKRPDGSARRKKAAH